MLAEDHEIAVLMAVSDPEAALCSHRVLSLADGRLSSMSPLAPLSADATPPSLENVIDFPRSPEPSLRDARGR